MPVSTETFCEVRPMQRIKNSSATELTLDAESAGLPAINVHPVWIPEAFARVAPVIAMALIMVQISTLPWKRLEYLFPVLLSLF